MMLLLTSIKRFALEKKRDIILFIALTLIIALAFGVGVIVGKDTSSPQIIIQQVN